MTPLEYMEKQVKKKKYDLGQQTVRGASEADLENIRKKIGYYEAAVAALERAEDKEDCDAGY